MTRKLAIVIRWNQSQVLPDAICGGNHLCVLQVSNINLIWQLRNRFWLNVKVKCKKCFEILS